MSSKMTYRERRLRKAERLKGWAEKREQKGEQRLGAAREILNHIPLGQPILVGHHSEKRARRDREKIDNHFREGFGNLDKAREMRERAEGIEHQAANAIYNDDPDAIERLQEKLAKLEESRERIKAYNATCRKGHPDRTLLSPDELECLLSSLKHAAWQCRKEAMPSYTLTNLGAQIRKVQERIAFLTRQRETS